MFEKVEFEKSAKYESQLPLFEKAHGNEKIREYLIESNMNLVGFVINRYFKNNVAEDEELVATGMLALIRAVDCFDVTKKTSFSTYACTIIKNDILAYLINCQNYNDNVVSLSAVLYNDNQLDDEKIALESTLADDTDVEKEAEDRMISTKLYEIITKLPEDYQEIIKLYFGFTGKSYTQGEIAKRIGISRQAVNDKIRRALKRLRIYYVGKEKIRRRKR